MYVSVSSVVAVAVAITIAVSIAVAVAASVSVYLLLPEVAKVAATNAACQTCRQRTQRHRDRETVRETSGI